MNSTPVLGFEARARGAMLGLAVGDAFGTTLEFSRPAAPEFPQLARGPHVTVTGGGPFGLRPGQVTDDSQMAACLATSLMARGGFDATDVAGRYGTWRKHAFDIGNQTAAALRDFATAGRAEDAGRSVWERQGRNPAGNGSLMRTAPIAVYYWDKPAERRRASMADSAITHFDPRCQLACAAFNAAIGAALVEEGPEQATWNAAHDELKAAAADLANTHPELAAEIRAAETALLTDLGLAMEPDPQLYGPELHIHDQAGFVRVAFRLAFWEMLHAPTFEAALVDVANRGGDADTNAAIAGALCGAVAGELEIPDAWKRLVLDALSDDLSSPFATDYHPRVLNDLVTSIKPRVSARRW